MEEQKTLLELIEDLKNEGKEEGYKEGYKNGELRATKQMHLMFSLYLSAPECYSIPDIYGVQTESHKWDGDVSLQVCQCKICGITNLNSKNPF